MFSFYVFQLVSAQWSSSSNVPRFAANLSFNPIEPLKPAEGGLKPIELNPSVLLQPSKIETVPQADFDWNSAGLVNPLDGELNFQLNLQILVIFCCLVAHQIDNYSI